MIEKLKSGPWEIVYCDLVPDQVEKIQERVLYWSEQSIDLVLTSGGTGFSQRDVTPEAILPLINKVASGLVHLMMFKSLQITQMAALSRPVCGTVGKTLVITLPGSPKGSVENFDALESVIPHALDLIRDSKDKIENLHSRMHAHDCVKHSDIDGKLNNLNQKLQKEVGSRHSQWFRIMMQ